MRFATKLGQLEKAAAKRGFATCRLCYGHPLASILVMHDRDPDGPGFRKTGDYYLLEGEDRLSDDLRCRRCGTEAVQLHLMDIAGIPPMPQGRLVKLHYNAEKCEPKQQSKNNEKPQIGL